MDGDGALELLLSPPNKATSGNVLVLRHEDGVVYGFVFSCRNMGIYKDGSFISSGSALLSALERMRFQKERLFVTELWYVDWARDVYRVNGKEVSREEMEKPDGSEPEDAEWYTYDEADFRE
ncbi:MAG: hypothetical protein FWE94_07115 [Coriobacteriia bacterium]|nr:hypothetical protein [Coriobacteriia bacterium]